MVEVHGSTTWFTLRMGKQKRKRKDWIIAKPFKGNNLKVDTRPHL
jgi:hypothetical protein